jgi:predicted LPLAT superfamily acyltransferase
MQPSAQSSEIAPKRRGNRLGIGFFKVSLHLFGLRGTYGFLYFVCLYYLLFDRSAVSAALAYIVRRFPGCGYLKGRMHVYRLFVNQGKHLIDRYALVSGAVQFDVQIKGYKQFLDMVKHAQRGLILLTAHVGNWQVAMTALKNINKTVCFHMAPEENPAVHESLRLSQKQERFKIISSKQLLGGVVEIMDALKQGHIVSMMGDRSDMSTVLEASFLGERAWFPYGAFHIAASVECPVVFLLSAKVSGHQYHVDFSHALYPHYASRKNKRPQLQKMLQEFVGVLEEYAKQYPYQCFLFHDVWGKEPKTGPG